MFKKEGKNFSELSHAHDSWKTVCNNRFEGNWVVPIKKLLYLYCIRFTKYVSEYIYFIKFVQTVVKPIKYFTIDRRTVTGYCGLRAEVQ